eukprot:14423167-Ditylum_brightwellii.AAC.1
MHINILDVVISVVEKFTSTTHLGKILHKDSAQRNDGVNNSSNMKAPKTYVYCFTSSLQDHVITMFGLDNLGYANNYAILFSKVGISLLPSISSYLERYEKREKI